MPRWGPWPIWWSVLQWSSKERPPLISRSRSMCGSNLPTGILDFVICYLGARMRRQLARCLWAVSFVTAVETAPRSQEAKDAKTQAIQPAEVKLGRPLDFERAVYPIHDAKCFACHNVAINENGLNLEDVKSILK